MGLARLIEQVRSPLVAFQDSDDMSHGSRLEEQVRLAFEGEAWHGPAVLEALAGVSVEEAAAHPIPGTHSIWEIVLHTIAWADIARARLRGERTGDPTPQEDWPPVLSGSGAQWTATLFRLHESHQSLATDVRQLDDAVLEGKATGLDYTVSTLLRGVVEHGTYHGGQIALLGTDLARLPGAARDRFRGANIGVIFQMFNLIPYLSVLDNITLPCRLSAARRRRLGDLSVGAAARELAEGPSDPPTGRGGV